RLQGDWSSDVCSSDLPVYLPKIYNGRNRTFFFFSYEGFRNRVGATATPYTVPPPEFFTGDLHNWVNASGKMIQVYDPSTTTLVRSEERRVGKECRCRW